MALAIDMSAVQGGGGIATPSYTWATKPTAASAAGKTIRITDVGQGNPGPSGGNFFWSNGVKWKPSSGIILLDAIDTANSGVANTTEQQLNPNHVVIPAGLLTDFDRLLLDFSASKDGTSDTATIRFRFGPLGTIADPVIAQISSLAATNRSYGTMLTFKRLSATTIQKQGNADPSASYVGASGGAYSSAVTVANMDTTPMYLTISAQMTTGTVEIPTINDYSLKLAASDT